MSHYPNPFDFVPFPATPILCTEEQFDAMGEKLSGYLELEIRALTPVHIMGRVEGGLTEHRSYMYRQDGRPCIPASSIRGCLRAFTEALTAGFVSQATPEYEKIYGKLMDGRSNPRGRHVGFRTFERYTPQRSSRERVSPEAVVPVFKPEPKKANLDVASYLFGIVADDKRKDRGEQAWKSKLWIEDAFLTTASIDREGYWMPDIQLDKAFMGGAKPSASNWWYFQPAEIWERRLPTGGSVAEFVGQKLRGRKFYFHQDPRACMAAYHPSNSESHRWNYPANSFHPIRLECMRQDAVSLPFRLYLDAVPYPLFQLLLRVFLLPGGHLRHKLGHAKAYGYGSVEIVLNSARLRVDCLGVPRALEIRLPQDMSVGGWSDPALKNDRVADFVDPDALIWLARILGWPHRDLLFMYPQYREQEFKQPIRYSRFAQRMSVIGASAQAPVVVSSEEQARAIADALWDLKRPIDFRLYQERAAGWDTIMQRYA